MEKVNINFEMEVEALKSLYDFLILAEADKEDVTDEQRESFRPFVFYLTPIVEAHSVMVDMSDFDVDNYMDLISKQEAIPNVIRSRMSLLKDASNAEEQDKLLNEIMTLKQREKKLADKVASLKREHDALYEKKAAEAYKEAYK